MQFFRRSDNVDAEFEEMSAEGQKAAPLSEAADDNANRKVDNAGGTQSYTLMQLFMDAELRQPLFIACALVTIQQFSGINAVRCYSSLRQDLQLIFHHNRLHCLST